MNSHQLTMQNSTIKLLRIIGSPFTHGHERPKTRNEALKLYKYATMNKIGFTYLESLKGLKLLEELGLETKYREEQKKFEEQLVTAVRISKILDSFNVEYVIFKSIMPFPAVQNDIDIIIFGSYNDYKTVINGIAKFGYMDLRKVYADKISNKQDAFTRQFHDPRDNAHKDFSAKDAYDFDIYQEVSLMDYMVYLDKKILRNYITTINLLNHQIKVLKPEAELVTIIAHSIIKEQLFTLHTYYAVLHHLAKMNSKQIKEFVTIVGRSNVTKPVRACFSMITEMHNLIHGFYPEKLTDIITIIGCEKRETKNLIKKDLEVPYHYSVSLIAKTFLDITKESKVRKSILRQVKSMINLEGIKRIYKGFTSLRIRYTY